MKIYLDIYNAFFIVAILLYQRIGFVFIAYVLLIYGVLAGVISIDMCRMAYNKNNSCIPVREYRSLLGKF